MSSGAASSAAASGGAGARSSTKGKVMPRGKVAAKGPSSEKGEGKATNDLLPIMEWDYYNVSQSGREIWHDQAADAGDGGPSVEAGACSSSSPPLLPIQEWDYFNVAESGRERYQAQKWAEMSSEEFTIAARAHNARAHQVNLDNCSR